MVRDRIQRLWFVDALALMPGEQIGNIVNRTNPQEITEVSRGPSAADAQNRLFADLDPDTRAWALARYTAHPIAAMDAPMELDHFWDQSWNASVVYCRQAVNPGEAHQRRCAEKLGAPWNELDCGHYPMLSNPDELTALLQG